MQHQRPFSLSYFTSMSLTLRLRLLCVHLLIQLIHHYLGTVTGEISVSSCIDCGIADVLPLCHNSTFVFQVKSSQRQTSEMKVSLIEDKSIR